MRQQFLPNIYNQPWYNGDPNEEDLYIANKKSILIGMPWMRQLRIRNSKPSSQLSSFYFNNKAAIFCNAIGSESFWADLKYAPVELRKKV